MRKNQARGDDDEEVKNSIRILEEEEEDFDIN
jgi:hypothetical protein